MLSVNSPLRAATAVALLPFLAACTDAPNPSLGGLNEPEITRLRQEAPPGAAPGTCWGKFVIPAIIETTTHQVMLQPAEIRVDGTITHPATFKTETRQEIVRERKETWFRTPCPEVMTPDFISSVQRALKARSVYRGPITGEMDKTTRAAVRKYQKPQGLDSGILSLAAARQLGLVAIEQE